MCRASCAWQESNLPANSDLLAPRTATGKRMERPRFLLVSCYSLVMATAFAEEAARIRETGHLTDGDIARATGAGVSTVGAWIRGTRSPRGERAERLAELSAIVDRLANVIEPAYIPVWLRRPAPALDDEKPIDLLARGEWRPVARLISALESPTFS